MAEPRRAVKLSVRFEVFKRDRYTCAYCGRTPPEVLLHVDHIVPVAGGGTNDITNLISACQDCNLGKGARLLDEGIRPTINRVAVEELEERIEQARAYMELVGSQQSIVTKKRQMVVDHWATLFHATTVEQDEGTFWTLPSGGRWPDEGTVLRFVRRLSLDFVLEAVEITGAKFTSASDGACRYFYGVCWREIRSKQPTTEPAATYTKEDMDAAFRSGQEDGEFGEKVRLRKVFQEAVAEGKDLFDAIAEDLDEYRSVLP